MKQLTPIQLAAIIILSVFFSAPAGAESLWERETFTEHLWDQTAALQEQGVEFGLGLTQIYQQNLRGGLSTHRRAGRYTGSYDVELNANLQKLFGWTGARIYMNTEGGWSDGLDDSSIASAFGVNGDAIGNNAIFVGELWFEQLFWDDTLTFRIGKIDLTGGFECRGCPVTFDGSLYANDETSQFLNGALINNPTIPFPDKTLGMSLYYNPGDFWYLGAGMADVGSSAQHVGLDTTFDGRSDFFYIAETGITPTVETPRGRLPGAYRLGLWYDPQPKAHSDAAVTGTDDVGFYTSMDQMLWKENDDPEDTQGLGTFFRYGYADPQRNDITHFWSIGLQYQGFFAGRDEDVLGFGFAKGIFSNAANTTYTDDDEAVYELYYSAQITKWFNVSPSVQYVSNPGGDASVDDAFVMGVRMQMVF